MTVLILQGVKPGALTLFRESRRTTRSLGGKDLVLSFEEILNYLEVIIILRRGGG
jgi:hypothetical protein